MTILGLDISKWNGNWNASKAKEAGIVFVFIKASQATFTDPRFIENWAKAKQAGLLRGAYHYLDYTKPASDQANYFANQLETDPGELPLVVDYEEKRTDNNYDLAKSYLQEFLTQLQTRKVKPMIYLSRGFWNTYGDASARWTDFPLWLANWMVNDAPPLPMPWQKWTFWQYTADGPGDTYGTESARVDLNRFYGTFDDLKQFVLTYKPTISPQPVAVPAEVRITTLENLVSNLEPVFTEAYSKLEGRVISLEEKAASGGIGNPVPGAEQRIITIEQQVQAFNQQNSVIGQQITDINLQLNQIKQQVSSLPATDLATIARLEQRVTAIEQQGTANTPPYNPQPNPPQTPPTTGAFAICNVRGLNVRSGPGTNYPVVTGLTYGQRVKALERQNGWAHLENPAGWCAELYLTFS